MKQSEVFLHGEADAWYERNKNKLCEGVDPVMDAMERYGIKPNSVLEVGCANGWRLVQLNMKYKCKILGIDPTDNSYMEGVLYRGEAADLGVIPSRCDTVIYGWCLYLCDPEDYFKISAEGDRVLTDGGFLIVYDFCTDHPYKVPYKHKKGIYSHHYDFSKLWSCHPAYSMYGRTVQDETCVTILKKNMQNAFPVEK